MLNIAKIAGNAPLVNVSTEYFNVKRERTVPLNIYSQSVATVLSR